MASWTKLRLTYSGNTPSEQQELFEAAMYAEADFAADADKRRGTTGTIMIMQAAAVLWISTLQSIFATSTAEAEYIASVTATKEGLWERKLLHNIYITLPR
jgi:hypothetical protein